MARWPWWVRIALIYVAARCVSFAILAAVALQQGPNPWGSSSPDYLHFVDIWDAEWYHRIFSTGYPGSIPRDAGGTALQNPWAFYPLYPFLVRGLNAITGVDWLVLAPAVSLLAGLAASLVIYRLFRCFASAAAATWAVAFFVTFPVSPVLQVPYAESISLLLLAGSLYLLLRRRYLWAIPVVALMCLSRPIGPPFAVVVLAHLLLRWWHRRRDPVSVRQLAAGGSLLLASALAAVAWPLIAWAVTGDIKAYTDTETAWRGGELTLFQPWFDEGQRLFGPILGLLAPAVLVIVFALVLNSPAARTGGTDLRLWCATYFGYLLAVLEPQTSTFRMLLPLFPLTLAAALVSPSRAYRGTVVVLFVLLQIVWVAWLWSWAPLPGGGDYPP
ncbi:hypothetical protein IV498_12640 [Paenarthrobacter sp. Z7-10]|nr:hypothetical protein [Paenarthrobacter sp. Z7-10]